MGFAAQPVHTGEVFGRGAHLGRDVAGVFGMERAPGFGVTADGGDDQFDEDAGILGAGAEKPGLRRAIAGAGER